MNTEEETYKERLTKWIENGYKREEAVIKVSELREWCERQIKESQSNSAWDLALRFTFNTVIDKFCKEGK